MPSHPAGFSATCPASRSKTIRFAKPRLCHVSRWAAWANPRKLAGRRYFFAHRRRAMSQASRCRWTAARRSVSEFLKPNKKLLMLLRDKVIFLTGGSSGIGLECASVYAVEGASVVVVAYDQEGVKKVAAELGPQHLGITCDISHGDEVKAAIAATLGRYGKLDAVHNNAGIATPSKPVHETTEAEWDALFDINLKGVYHTTRHAFNALKASKGCILNTSSLVGVISQENHAAYNATKGGMNTLTKSMTLDYAKHAIRVNAVCPAGVWTPMSPKWCADEPNP